MSLGPGRWKRTNLNEREGTPWRYVCPACGSTTVYPRQKLEADGTGGRPARNGYYCDGHNGSIPTVYDKMKGHEVRP